ncbi:AB-hydrolase YheT [Ramaria rubella]|nr:AB-hydrolase YheT [Ramaria rubella]
MEAPLIVLNLFFPSIHLSLIHLLKSLYFALFSWIQQNVAQFAFFTQHPTVSSFTKIIHGLNTANVSLDSGEVTMIHTIVRDQVPSLSSEYRPPWWLALGDLQTIWSSVFHHKYVACINYERKYIIVPDGGCISLDITPPVSTALPPNVPVVVVLHGLLGGSHASYVRSAVSHITRKTAQGGLGLRVVVFNLRGCSRTPVTSSLLYHPGMTDDLRSVILYVSSQFPHSKLFGLGFSLGAGYLTNYLSEEGDASPLSAAFVVSNVWDYAGCSLELSHGRLISRILYNPVLGLGHQKVIARNREAFKSHPRIAQILEKRIMTMSWISAHFTAHLEGIDPLQFLHNTSCAKSIAGVRIPLICLNARDDPLLPESYLPVNQVKASKHVVMVVTDRGGHLGWVTANTERKREMDVWYTPAIIEYFRAMLRIREDTPRITPRATVSDKLGMVRQVGRPNVGFLEVLEKDI